MLYIVVEKFVLNLTHFVSQTVHPNSHINLTQKQLENITLCKNFHKNIPL